MSLASRIAARSRRPTATVTLGGRRWRGVLSLSRSQEYGQGVSTGTVVGRDPPVSIVEGETTISWSWGYDGYEVAGFTGVVVAATLDSYPNRWTLTVADELWRAEIERKDIETDPLNDIAASEAIRQILEGAGVARLSIPELSASGSAWAGTEWVLGTLTPVSFAGTTALAAAQSIAGTIGYWLYCDAAGVVRAAQLERRPSSSPFRTLTWGSDFLLAGPPNRRRDAANVKNKVTVRGANTGVEGAQIFDTWQTGAANRSFEATYPLIEYVNESEAGAASIVGVAKRLILLWSRQPNVITVGKLKADPRIGVGMTLSIVCPPIGYSTAVPFFVYRLQTSMDLRTGAFDQSLTLDGGTGDQGYTTIPPPLASMTWRIVREALDGVGVVELFLDGSGSQSLASGEIVSWAWESATSTQAPFPDAATGVRAMFVYPAATATAVVTLTVTDTASKVGTLTQTIDLTGDALASPTERTISLALGAAWAVTPDGGQTWNVEATGDAIVVPEHGGGTLLATQGAGGTGLRGTGDALATASTSLASLGGAITALAQTRGLPERVWAAVGANLYLSLDEGETFAAWGTLPATIVDVLEDPALPFSVFVLSGNTMYQSTSATNPGTAWVPLYVGPTGATARQLVRGLSGATTWVAYTGTFTSSPLHRVEGPLTVAFPVDVSPLVTEIRAIAMNDAETELYAWDQEGRIWIVDAQTGVGPTLSTQSHDASETVQHALHDPDHPIVYVATFGASAGITYKYFPLVDTLLPFYTPAAGQQAHRVGLSGESTAPETSFPSKIESSLALNLGSAGTPPSGWEQPAYGTSGWDPAELSTAQLPVDDGESICAPGDTPGDGVQLTRQTITLPAGEILRARLRVRADNNATVYVNGTEVGVVSGFASVTTLTVDPALLTPGENVVIACEISNIEAPPPNPISIAYVLDINHPL